MNFSFNGISKSYISINVSERRPSWAPVQRNLLVVKGMPGAHLESTDIKERILSVPIQITNNDFSSLQKVKEDLADWLITDNPAELIFDDEPDRIYYAVVDGSLDLEEIVNFGRGTITFICPDSRKHGAVDSINFQNTASFSVGGTEKTDPVISCTISQDTTFVAVSNGDKINMIGNPVRQEETTFEPETPILLNSCNTLTGWTNSSSTSIEGAEQLGTLKTNGNDFYTDDYGMLVSSWHGPAMKTSLSEAVQDFRFDVGFTMQKSGNNQAGGIEVALLDANNKITTKVAMTKHFGELNNLYSRIRAGNGTSGYDIVNENQAIFQSAISCIFRVIRKEKVWTAQIFYAENGVFKSKILNTWTDNNNVAIAPITQVQARLIQRGDFPLVTQSIQDINIYRLNNAVDGQVPLIARAGDVIEFDHQTDIIRRNGIDVTKEKAFIGEYFPLTPGPNIIVAEPAVSISNVEVRWRPKWL